MGIQQRTINGRALYEAMRLGNGVEHIRGEWFGELDENGKPTAGCAMGLMAINLGIRGNDSHNANANLLDQLRNIRLPEDSKWHIPNEEPQFQTVADAIMHWNDVTHIEKYRDTNTGWIRDRDVYDLATFEEVHQMVHDILEPHFATEFTVDVWAFDAPNFS